MMEYFELFVDIQTALAVLALAEKVVEHEGHWHLWDKWTGRV